MEPADQALLRLADPAARAGLLDADALLQIAVVSYVIDPATVTEPTTAVYDRLELAVPAGSGGSAVARLMRAGDALPWDVSATWDDGRAPAPGADAVMVARLALRADRGGGTISQVDTAVVDPIPVGAPTGLSLRLTMSAPPDPATSAPLTLPVVVAFLVADVTTGPRDLLRATAVARRATAGLPRPDPPADAPPRRVDRCVCWLLPAAAFDDDGWPGGTGATQDQRRTARLAAARAWLATHGIAVVTT
jgi:hypothetical protein